MTALYRENGYQFLAISDHDLYSDYRYAFDRDDFIILPALEASAVLYEDETKKERLKIHHIHGILGTEKMQKESKKEAFTHLEKYSPRVYYGQWDGTVNESATGYDPIHWDTILRSGKKIYATASDENHNDGIVEDSFGGFIVVKAEELQIVF